MAMLIIPMALAKIAIVATIAMANGNFSMFIRGIQLKSTKNVLSDVRFI